MKCICMFGFYKPKQTLSTALQLNRFQFAHRAYVRQLDWCAKDSAEKKSHKKWRTVESKKDTVNPNIPNKFGIIAAASNNYVIGLDGQLPWRIKEDVDYFKEITANKVLVLGRISFEESSNQAHLQHCRHIVVVSKTMTAAAAAANAGHNVHVTKSFDEALQLAHTLTADSKNNHDHSTIDCWIGGGQLLFEQALLHPSAFEVHLTKVNVDINELAYKHLAKFPAEYRWDYRFKKVSSWPGSGLGTCKLTGKSNLEYSFNVYECFRPR